MIRAARSLAVIAAVVLAVVALTGGISWLGHRASGGPGDPRPSPGRNLDLELSYVGLTPAGPRLFTETHAVPGSRDPALTVAIRALLTDSPRDDDYRNYLLRSHLHAKAVERDGTITIDFSAPPQRGSDMSDATVRMVVQALVHTADSAVGSEVPVRFAVAGKPVSSLLGVDTSRSIEPVDDSSVISPVAIDSPGETSLTRGDGAVRGRASTADGRVHWAVYEDAARPVASGRSEPGRCCELVPFTFRLPDLAPGAYTLVVGDGPDLTSDSTTVDTKHFGVPR